MTSSLVTGPELRALREKAGVTQERIARRAGWAARGRVSDIEGKISVTQATAARYLKALLEEQVASGS